MAVFDPLRSGTSERVPLVKGDKVRAANRLSTFPSLLRRGQSRKAGLGEVKQGVSQNTIFII